MIKLCRKYAPVCLKFYRWNTRISNHAIRINYTNELCADNSDRADRVIAIFMRERSVIFRCWGCVSQEKTHNPISFSTPFRDTSRKKESRAEKSEKSEK